MFIDKIAGSHSQPVSTGSDPVKALHQSVTWRIRAGAGTLGFPRVLCLLLKAHIGIPSAVSLCCQLTVFVKCLMKLTGITLKHLW